MKQLLAFGEVFLDGIRSVGSFLFETSIADILPDKLTFDWLPEFLQPSTPVSTLITWLNSVGEDFTLAHFILSGGLVFLLTFRLIKYFTDLLL
jgi:hypothetical protein